MLARFLACMTLTGVTVFAGWERSVDGWKGGLTDSPSAHSLKYFLVDPCLRPASDPLGANIDCTFPGAPPPTPAELKRRAETQTKMDQVGKIAAFTIYDLWYSRGGGFAYPNPDVRSVLVQTGRDQYREIDVQLRRGDAFPGSEIVRLQRR